MTFPTVAVPTTSLDSDTDVPADARVQLLDLAQKVNQIIAHVSAFSATYLDDADAAAVRSTLGLGTLSTQSGTFSGTSSGTNTGDQTNISGSAATAGIPQRSSSANTTTVAADANGQLLHPTADNNPRTFTIDSNANVPYAIGTCITFVNEINTLTIAIASDTLVLAGAGTTGSRTLGAMSIATAIKKTSTSWLISGSGLT